MKKKKREEMGKNITNDKFYRFSSSCVRSQRDEKPKNKNEMKKKKMMNEWKVLGRHVKKCVRELVVLLPMKIV